MMSLGKAKLRISLANPVGGRLASHIGDRAALLKALAKGQVFKDGDLQWIDFGDAASIKAERSAPMGGWSRR
jgi:hypothetical protein